MKIGPRLVLLGATAALWTSFANAEVPRIAPPQVRVHVPRLHVQPPKVHVPKPNVSVRVHAPHVHAHSPKVGLSHVPGAAGHHIKAGETKGSHGSIASGHHAKAGRTVTSVNAKNASSSSASQNTDPKGKTATQKSSLSPASAPSNLAGTLMSMCPAGQHCTLSPGGEVITWGTPGQPGAGAISYNGTNAQGQATYEYSVNGGPFLSYLGTQYGSHNGCIGNACDYFFIPKVTTTPPNTTTPPPTSPPNTTTPPHGTGVVNVPSPPRSPVSDDDTNMTSGHSGTTPFNPPPAINPELPPRAPGSQPVPVLPPPVAGNPSLPPPGAPPAILPPTLLKPGQSPPMVGNPGSPPSASPPNAVLPPSGGAPRTPPRIPVPIRPGASAGAPNTPAHPPAVFAMPGGSLYAAIYDDAKGGYVLPGGVVMPAQSGQLLSNYANTFKNAPSGGITGPGVPGGYVAPFSDITGLSPQNSPQSGGMTPAGVAPPVGGQVRGDIEQKTPAGGNASAPFGKQASSEQTTNFKPRDGAVARGHRDAKADESASSPSIKKGTDGDRHHFASSSGHAKAQQANASSANSKTSHASATKLSVNKSSTGETTTSANGGTGAAPKNAAMKTASTIVNPDPVGNAGCLYGCEVFGSNGQIVGISVDNTGTYGITGLFEPWSGNKVSFSSMPAGASLRFTKTEYGYTWMYYPGGGKSPVNILNPNTDAMALQPLLGDIPSQTTVVNNPPVQTPPTTVTNNPPSSHPVTNNPPAQTPPTTVANNPPPPSSPQSGSSSSAPHNFGNDLGAAFNPPPLNGPGTSLVSGGGAGDDGSAGGGDGRTYLPGDLGLPSLAAIDAGSTGGGNDRGPSSDAGTSYASNDNSGSGGAGQSGSSNSVSTADGDKTFGQGLTLMGGTLGITGALTYTSLGAEGLSAGAVVVGAVAGGAAIVVGAGFGLAGVFIVGVSLIQ